MDTWAFSQHDGCVPRTGTQKEPGRSCITSYELALEFTVLHFGQKSQATFKEKKHRISLLNGKRVEVSL